MENKTKQVVVIDPSEMYERRLKYEEKHGLWETFKAIYWSFFILIIGTYMTYFYTSSLNLITLFGWILILFAFFYIIFGLTKILHLKLMRRVS